MARAPLSIASSRVGAGNEAEGQRVGLNFRLCEPGGHWNRRNNTNSPSAFSGYPTIVAPGAI
jgi:hypothetical protein